MASWSSESHSSSGGTDCSLMNTASRMRRSSALSFCQSAMRTLTSFFIGKLQASLFDQLDQQGTGFVVAQTLVKIIPMQRSEEHTSELQSRENLVCRLLLEKKKITVNKRYI